MENPKVRTALTILGIIILVVLMASVIYGIIRNLSGDDDSTQISTQVEETEEKRDLELEENAKTGEVKFRARGPIVAREEHYQIEVTINRDRRTIEVYRGYEEDPIVQESFNNDLEAFTQFLYATKRAGMFTSNTSNINTDGYCYRGELRTYSTSGFGDDVEQWSNSCNKQGTISNDRYLLNLVKDQFVDYKQYVRGI